jgi:uncharacterized protein YjdB
MVWLRRRAFAGYTGTLYALALLSGCGSSNEPNGPANITLDPSSLSFNAIGQTQQLSPTVTDQQGNPSTDVAVSWTSSDANVASVSSSGVVTAASNGSAEISATAGSAQAVAEVTVAQTPANITLDPTSLSFNAVGQTQQLSPTITDQRGNAITGAAVSWTTSNPAVASVSSSGIVTAAGSGSAEITGTAGSASAVAEVTVTLTPAPASITLDPPSLSFNAIGQNQRLSPTVTDQQGNVIRDAAISWTTTNPAVASVSSSGIVTAAGNGSVQINATAGSASAVAEVTVIQTPAQVKKNLGDGQTVVAGQPVPTPPSVLVTDANQNPVPAVQVTFEVTSGRGQVTTGVVATDNNGIAQVGGWSPGSKGSNVLTATAAGSGISGNPVRFTATGTSAFDIEVRFLGSATAGQRQAFNEAKERWESLVTGDVEDIPLQTAAEDCGPGSPALNQTIDDLLIFVTLEEIDGPGGVLGSAGPCFIRNSNSLSLVGAMIFDKEDLASIEDAGLLQTLILHEMGHVLGFGSLWPTMGLLADPSLPPATGTDPHFTGAQAIAAFDQVGGTAYTGAKVPVEDTGGEGTADGHWRESVFINELMTGFVDLGENPLSIVTVSSLADQGYVVNKVGVDPFSLTLSLRALSGRHRFQLGSDVLRLPIKKVDRAGGVTGYFRR